MVNYILGNGITARIFALYNREYKIIGDSNSFALSKYGRNMVLLQDNPYNRKLIEDISTISGNEILFSIKNYDVLVFSNKRFHRAISEDEKTKNIEKKSTALNGKKLRFNKDIFAEQISLSEEKSGMLKVIDFNFELLMHALDEIIHPQQICNERILSIDYIKKEIVTDNGTIFPYSEAICTLPYNVFLELCSEQSNDFETLDTTIVESTENKLGVERIPYENAIVYYPESEYEFGKIIKKNNVCYAEITGTSQKFKGEVSKNTRLVRSYSIRSFPDIIFFGRYAEWNPDIRIQDIVRRSSCKTTMQNLWKDQERFSAQFFNFERNLETVQKNTKECSMLLIDEIFSLLSKINWKEHSVGKKALYINEIKEEWIDCFKYLLTIGINLGLTYEDFVDAYWSKSKKLDANINKFKRF